MHVRKLWICSLLLLLSSSLVAQIPETISQQPYPGTITLSVDASAAYTKLFRAKLSIPVKPGPITLLYPKWIPGEHGPTGPVVDLTGLKFFANGKPVAWRRDDVEMYAIHVDVPQGVTTLEATLDYTSPVESGIYSGGPTASDKLAVVSWNPMLLYPAGYDAEKITYHATLKAPAGWQIGTALPMSSHTGDTYDFTPCSLYTLVDSPVLLGQYFKVLPLNNPPGTPPVEMDIAADSTAALQFIPGLEDHLKQLPMEAVALFGATHYRDYHFLLSLSDHVAHFGLEHHESNDSRIPEDMLSDKSAYKLLGGVIPHEYVHSWNGKYRRPVGLATQNYEQPMKGDLLWVYEGLTEYLGDVLMARTGMWTPERYRENLARVAAELNNRSGRTWRPLEDTAVSVQTLNYAPFAWSNWRRGLDYYDEGELIWLEVDTTIRRLTHGQKSIDDFTHVFYGQPSLPPNQAPVFKSYTFDDLVNTLNQIAPYDWAKFFHDRLWSTSPNAPMGGVEASGWNLVYTDKISELQREMEADRHFVDVGFSLGLIVSDRDGKILDSYFFKPAANAGITPGMKLIAVNGRRFTPDVLRTAIREAKGSKQPIQLLIENADYFKTYTLDYHDGEKYPVLERNGNPDTLADILRAHAGK
jgi:predicted metalloprotease with PDZ domain